MKKGLEKGLRWYFISIIADFFSLRGDLCTTIYSVYVRTTSEALALERVYAHHNRLYKGGEIRSITVKEAKTSGHRRLRKYMVYAGSALYCIEAPSEEDAILFAEPYYAVDKIIKLEPWEDFPRGAYGNKFEL